MRYIRYTINTTTSACDDICYELTNLGLTALEIEDNLPVHDEIQGKDYEELLPDTPEDDGLCKIKFYLEQDNKGLISQVQSVLEDISSYSDIGEGTLESEVLEDEDYLNKWKEYFHAFEVGDLLIKPTWEQVDTPKGVHKCILIDPGTTFGTGAHETTRLCIEGIQKHLKSGDNVLDLGFGSGILSMTALLYGASHVSGTDIDPDCVDAACENFKANNLDVKKAAFYIGDLASDKVLQNMVGYDCFDIIVANILADILIDMSTPMYNALKKGGIVITSGIIDFKENAVKKSLVQAGLTITEINHLGEWVSITAIKE